MLDPEVVLYDEPTGGLDPVTSHKVEEIVWRTCRRGGVTSVAVSHDMASALRIADRILVLNAGRLATAGTPVELVHGRHPLVQAFLQASGVSVERILDERPDVASW
jgi:phospholipid/cholesterol/gamma-HCH transport system ATP-binding protein